MIIGARDTTARKSARTAEAVEDAKPVIAGQPEEPRHGFGRCPTGGRF